MEMLAWSCKSFIIVAAEVDEICSIMHSTLPESKGLEFDDVDMLQFILMSHPYDAILQVLIYNFFNDSNVKASYWRVVLNIISDHSSKILELRHNIVCQEVIKITPHQVHMV